MKKYVRSSASSLDSIASAVQTDAFDVVMEAVQEEYNHSLASDDLPDYFDVEAKAEGNAIKVTVWAEMLSGALWLPPARSLVIKLDSIVQAYDPDAEFSKDDEGYIVCTFTPNVR